MPSTPSIILYKDDSVIVAIKPAGLLSEGNGKDSFPTRLCKEAELTEIYPVHRLDRETEGIMVYALTREAAAALSRDIAAGNWKKVYIALVWGRPDTESGRLCDLLYYDRKNGRSFVVSRERKGVKQAVLDYSVIANTDESRTALRIELKTGRTHQIRVQFASRGLPLCGDRRYGAPKESANALALCATELHLIHPITRKELDFKMTPSNFSI